MFIVQTNISGYFTQYIRNFVATVSDYIFVHKDNAAYQVNASKQRVCFQ